MKWNRNQKSKWRFTCDSNENGVADENETFLTEWIKNGDFSKIVLNCGDLDNCLGCLDSNIKWVNPTGPWNPVTNIIFRITNSNKKNPGDILISCGQTLSTSQASIKFTCDKNANGIEDNGELELFKTYTLAGDGTCSRKNKAGFK